MYILYSCFFHNDIMEIFWRWNPNYPTWCLSQCLNLVLYVISVLRFVWDQKYHSMIFVHTVFLFHIRSIIDNEVKRFLIICNNFLMIQFDLPNKVRISYDFHLSFNYRSIVILSYTLIYDLRFMGSNENKLHRLNHTGLSVHLEKWK